MKIAEALKQIHELQHLKGTKLPGLNNVINDIIPAPNDSRFEVGYSGDADPLLRSY
jgi:predicted amino acid racemase